MKNKYKSFIVTIALLNKNAQIAQYTLMHVLNWRSWEILKYDRKCYCGIQIKWLAGDFNPILYTSGCIKRKCITFEVIEFRYLPLLSQPTFCLNVYEWMENVWKIIRVFEAFENNKKYDSYLCEIKIPEYNFTIDNFNLFSN